jgi:putative membrane protein
VVSRSYYEIEYTEGNMVGIKQFVFRWAVTTIAVMVASSVIRGIRYDTVASLIGASLLLGILNAFVRPFLLILSAPIILVTLGLFIFVLNGLLLLLVPNIVVGFHVAGFWSAFWGAIVISFVSWILSAFFRGSDGRVHILTHHTGTRQVRGRVLEDGERR